MATKKEVLEMALRGEGCLGKAADDEPVFVLRAQDITAAGYVQDWAMKASGRLGYEHPKVKDAGETSKAMKQWPTRKYPD